VLSPAAPGAQITPSPAGTVMQVKQMLGRRAPRALSLESKEA